MLGSGSKYYYTMLLAQDQVLYYTYDYCVKECDHNLVSYHQLCTFFILYMVCCAISHTSTYRTLHIILSHMYYTLIIIIMYVILYSPSPINTIMFHMIPLRSLHTYYHLLYSESEYLLRRTFVIHKVWNVNL